MLCTIGSLDMRAQGWTNQTVRKFHRALRSFDPAQGGGGVARRVSTNTERRHPCSGSTRLQQQVIGAQFCASEDMVRFRRNMTGVDKQIFRTASVPR